MAIYSSPSQTCPSQTPSQPWTNLPQRPRPCPGFTRPARGVGLCPSHPYAPSPCPQCPASAPSQRQLCASSRLSPRQPYPSSFPSHASMSQYQPIPEPSLPQCICIPVPPIPVPHIQLPTASTHSRYHPAPAPHPQPAPPLPGRGRACARGPAGLAALPGLHREAPERRPGRAGPGRAGVPRQAVPCSDSQTCEQMDCFENGKICTQTGFQQHRESSGNQVTEAGRPVRRLRRKRRLPLDSEDEEENAYEDEEKNKSNNMKSRRNTKPIKQVLPGKKKAWNWSSYLEEEQMPAAPQKLFREYQSFPQGRNGFKVGMKLEGVDPEHPARFCVLTVAEVQGYRMRLHFDGYPECYDFWANADSSDIHPVGWCEKTSHKLLPPKGFKEGEFNWTSYLKNCKAQAAPKSLFKTPSSPVTPSGFRLGMKLEAVDKKNPSLVCVATITDMVENRLLIHFDNWDESYDYWCETSSPYIRPVGYCQETGTPLTTPPGHRDSKAFSWEKYLEETNSQAAPARAFKLRPPHGFQVNTKLEAVDRRNPILIRVATIIDKDSHRIKIHFDGWDHDYDFWVDADSPDIHPVGWCDKTGHALQVPRGAEDPEGAVGQACPTPGCQGIGHVRGPRYGTHYTLVGCPYSDMNLSRENLLQDRLSGERPSLGNIMQKAKRLETPGPLLGAGESSQGDSSQSRKSAPDSEKWCQSSIHTPSEQSEDSRERGWGEEDFSADIKAAPKMLGCSHAYIKFQLVKQESNAKDPDLDLQQALHQSIFMPSLASNPTHRLHLFWEQHCRLLPEVSGLTAKQVAKWTVEEVVSFIQRLPGCKEQASVFREEQIDGEAFLLLKQNDIIKILSIKLGPALKIYNAILMFKSAEDN